MKKKTYPIYEVKSCNTTVEWTTNKVQALDVHGQTHDAKLYELNPDTGAKVRIK